MKEAEFLYEKIINNNCIISKMAVNMAAKKLNIMFLSFAVWYKSKSSVNSYEEKDVECVGINNNFLISKMAAKFTSLYLIGDKIR